MIFMLAFSGKDSDFIEKHPTVKMFALSLLVMIGFALIVQSFHLYVEKAYIYFSLVFSILEEGLNMAYRS
jgi:predicted tellurium resistance membrane protein TerC